MKRQPAGEVDTLLVTSRSESDKQLLVEIGLRIKRARQELGLSQKELANEAGAKSSRGLQDNEYGNAMAGGHIVLALARRGINTNWIFTGAGEMRVSDRPYMVANNHPQAQIAADSAFGEPAAAPSPVPMNIKAFTAILEGIIKAGAPVDQAIPAAFEFYNLNIERGLITPESIGKSRKKSA